MIEEGRPFLPRVVEDMANPPWEEAEAHILIVRLSRWKDLDVSTSHLVLFDEVRKSLPGAFVDFAFLPPFLARKALDTCGEAWFSGRISGRSPAEFDLVLVSNAFALELVNLPYLFSTAGLPLEARQRATMEATPLFVLGGSNASASGVLAIESATPGEPASDSIVDGIFFGEGEGAAGPLALILCRGSEKGRPGPEDRRLNLKDALSILGFWPCLVSGGTRRALAEERPRSLRSPLVLNGPEASTARLSISSGCPGFCSFCLEGWDKSPYAEADFDRLITEAKAIRRSTGASNLELYSFNFNTHSRIAELLFEFNRIFRHVSLLSQRLDILAETQGLLEMELAAGKRSFTLGVEGISSGMRAYYRKGLSNAQIDSCVELCLGARAREIKLFYIIAGIESGDDLAEFERFVYRLGLRKKGVSSSTKILVSAGFLVRLPFTPLQFAPLELDPSKLEGIGLRMKASCKSAGIEFRLASDLGETFVDQALSLLGPAVRPWLLGIPARRTVYESSLPVWAWASMKPYILKGKEANALVGEKDGDFRPPLAFADSEARQRVLYSHYLEARDRKDRSNCLGSSCSACGACSDPDQIRALTGHVNSIPAPSILASRTEALLKAKARFQPLDAAFFLPPDLAGADPSYRASWLLRRLSASISGVEGFVFEAREKFFVQGGSFSSVFSGGMAWYGWSAFELYGPSFESLAKLLRNASSLSGIEIVARESNPGWVKVDLDLESISPAFAKEALSSFASSKDLGFTASREGEGWKFDLAPGNLGRKILASARIAKSGTNLHLHLGLGEKAELRPLVEALEKQMGHELKPRVLGWEGFSPKTGEA